MGHANPFRGDAILNNRQLVEDLCAISPALRESRRVHLASYPTLMPHVFMGDVLRRVGECIATAGVPGEEATQILSSLEHGMVDGDRETRNVIAVSFACDAQLESFFPRLRRILGPRMRAQVG